MSNPAAVPTPVEDVQGDRRWMNLHDRYVAETKEKEADVVFIGDSLIQYLEHTEIWEKKISQFHCINFGCSADTTANVLWRLHNGELDFTTKPKVIVVLAGTNNHGHNAEQVVGGLEAIVKLISEKQPEATILLLTIPPRGLKPNPLREKIAKINKELPHIVASIPRCQLVDIGDRFIQSDGTINHHDMYDYLHFTKLGYWKAFEPVYDLLEQILVDDNAEDETSPTD